MSSAFPILSAAIWIPILAGAFVLAVGNDRNAGVVRTVSLAGALLGLLATLPLFLDFDRASADMQFVEQVSWIAQFSANYHLGVDGISVWFPLLTAFITVIVVIAGWEVIEDKVAQNTPIIRPERIRKDAMYCATFSSMTSQPATTTMTVMKAVSSGNQTEMPSTPR